MLITKINSALTVSGTGLNALHILSHLISITIVEGNTNIISMLQIREHPCKVG